MKKILIVPTILISTLFANSLSLENNKNGLNLNMNNSVYDKQISCIQNAKGLEDLQKCNPNYKINLNLINNTTSTQNNSKTNIPIQNEKNKSIEKEVQEVEEAEEVEFEEFEEVEEIDYSIIENKIRKCIKEASSSEELAKCKNIKN